MIDQETISTFRAIFLVVFILIVSIVGFERENYTITESEDAELEVCVRVYNPPLDEELPYNIFLVYQSETILDSAAG